MLHITKYKEMLTNLKNISNSSIDFDKASYKIEAYINRLPLTDYMEILRNIGIFPVNIKPSSSMEKLYSKASDVIFNRGMNELGLNSYVLNKRGDAGDIVAKSPNWNYSIVGDSKVSRLSRSARNQKDFKIQALNHWRSTSTDGPNTLTYSALCPSIFDYPVTRNSQVFHQAVKSNVCLFSWEYLEFFIQNGVKESSTCNLSKVWTFSETLRRVQSKSRLIDLQNNFYNNIGQKYYNTQRFTPLTKVLSNQAMIINSRAEYEKAALRKLPREVDKAIKVLIRPFMKKNNGKIKYINKYLRRVKHETK